MFLFQVIEGEVPKQENPGILIEESWFKEIAGGDMNTFAKLYNCTKNTVYAYALSILKHPQDAEDVMQDAYVNIRSASGVYKAQGKPLAWILTIVKNLCLMRIRTRKKSEAYIEEMYEQEEAFYKIEDPEDRIVLCTALRILKEEERNILILHAVTGMKHKEIAENIGIPLSTVLSKYRRALKKLKTYLTEQEGIESWQTK